MSAARNAWLAIQLDLDPDSLVFIDETAAATNMVRPYGRSERGERFLAYVSDTLVPVLKRGDTVILDNLSVRKVAGVRETIQAAGARLPRSPGPTARTSTRSSKPSPN